MSKLRKCCTTHGSWGPEVLYNPWAMGGKIVVQPMTHGPPKCCTTHGSWATNSVVQRCMAHGSWDIVTLYGPWVMGKKSLNGVQTVIGSLLYLTLGTRPDIAFAVTKLAQYAARPTQEHLNKALYICRYLVGTTNYCITYDGSTGHGLMACTDSDWASDSSNRKSQLGYFLKLAGGAIS